jgi:hypothetical protein
MGKAHVFSPAEFVEQLVSEAFVPPVALSGWIKVDKQTKGSLQFSPEQSCDSWITVPLSLVASVEYLGMTRCEDHRHPVVNLHLAPPANDEMKALYSMLETMTAKARRLMRQSVSGPPQPRGSLWSPACKACMSRCEAMQDYDAMVDCSYECFWGACHD